MPGTADGVADKEAVVERRAVVSAKSIKGENLLSASRENYRLSTRVAQQHSPVVDLRDRDAQSEVRPSEGGGGVGHSISMEPEARPSSPRASRRASNRW